MNTYTIYILEHNDKKHTHKTETENTDTQSDPLYKYQNIA